MNNFRYDINGLRAVAVVAVVLFHFNPIWVPGGFSGVDVFFVISGFLMTKIIFNGLENDNFNIVRFYIARANRIIPPLSGVCLVLLVFGWFYLSPIDYKTLSKHIISSIGFISNIIYWKESGYFDAVSYKKWLLHTWSLSVEWQFYIIYPVILVALKKFLSFDNLKRLILAGTLLSLCLSIVATMTWINASYYLLPTRAWEMMMGGIAFIYPWNISKNRKKIINFVGLALILTSCFFISSSLLWPGYLALIPVLGAFLVLISNQQSGILDNIFSQSLGKYSYSIYLWHWPIYVYYKDNSSQEYIYIYILLSFFIGFLSFNFIENKYYSLKTKFSIFTSVIILSFLSLFLDTQGFWIPNNIIKIQNYPNEWEYTWQEHNKRANKNFTTEKKKILIIGDSQAGDLLNMLIESGINNNNYEIVTRKTSTYCSLISIQTSDTKAFIKNNPYIPKKINAKTCLSDMKKIWTGNAINKADYIFIAMHVQPSNLKYLKYGIKKLRDNSPGQIVLFSRKIISEGSHKIAYKYYNNPFNKYKITLEQYAYQSIKHEYLNFNEKMERIAGTLSVKYLNFINILCPENKCSIIYENEPIYYDEAHITKYGARFFGKKIVPELNI